MTKSKLFPLAVAIVIAVIALIYYILSGTASLNTETRELEKSGEIQEINTTGSDKVKVTCKNGRSYEILFTEGQQNYEELIFNACGAEGAVDQE